MTTYLDLVAVGTIADVMRLQGENRVIVTYGLLLLQQTDNPGLRCMLMREAGVETRRMTASVVSFTLAPLHQCCRTHGVCRRSSAAVFDGQPEPCTGNRRLAVLSEQGTAKRRK